MTSDSRANGFSLVELAIVLFVIGLLMGSFLVPLATQLEQARIQAANKQMNEIIEALLGFAVVNDRLPCPAMPDSQGREINFGVGANQGRCFDTATRSIGFVPAVTLSLEGAFLDDQLLLDPWGNPYRYAITSATNGGPTNPNTAWYYVWPRGIQNQLTDNGPLVPYMEVCSTSGAGNPICDDDSVTLTTTAVALVMSMGPNWATTTVAPAGERLDERDNINGVAVGGGPSGTFYPMNTNKYVKRVRTDSPGNEFDDIVKWISPNILYSRLTQAGRLP